MHPHGTLALDKDTRSVEEVINLLIAKWGVCDGWQKEGSEQPHEATLLKLDCSKARQHLAWVPRWSLETAIEKIVLWQKSFQQNKNMQEISLAQIKQYLDS